MYEQITNQTRDARQETSGQREAEASSTTDNGNWELSMLGMKYVVWPVYETLNTETGTYRHTFMVINREESKIQSTWNNLIAARKAAKELNGWMPGESLSMEGLISE